MKPETVELRQRVYDLLGGCCAACGETDYDKLQIDHIQNDGAADRRLHAHRGEAKYRRFLARYPRHGSDDRQLLCFNCNLAKSQRHMIEDWKPMTTNGQLPSPSQHGGEEGLGTKRTQLRISVLPDVEKALRARSEATSQNLGEVVEDLAKFLDRLTMRDQILVALGMLDVKIDELLARRDSSNHDPEMPQNPYWHVSPEGIAAAEQQASVRMASSPLITPVVRFTFPRRMLRWLWTH